MSEMETKAYAQSKALKSYIFELQLPKPQLAIWGRAGILFHNIHIALHMFP